MIDDHPFIVLTETKFSDLLAYPQEATTKRSAKEKQERNGIPRSAEHVPSLWTQSSPILSSKCWEPNWWGWPKPIIFFLTSTGTFLEGVGFRPAILGGNGGQGPAEMPGAVIIILLLFLQKQKLVFVRVRS